MKLLRKLTASRSRCFSTAATPSLFDFIDGRVKPDFIVNPRTNAQPLMPVHGGYLDSANSTFYKRDRVIKLPINGNIAQEELIRNLYAFGDQVLSESPGPRFVTESIKYYKYIKENVIDLDKDEGKWLATNAEFETYHIFDSEQEAYDGLQKYGLLSQYVFVNCIDREYLKAAISPRSPRGTSSTSSKSSERIIAPTYDELVENGCPEGFGIVSRYYNEDKVIWLNALIGYTDKYNTSHYLPSVPQMDTGSTTNCINQHEFSTIVSADEYRQITSNSSKAVIFSGPQLENELISKGIYVQLDVKCGKTTIGSNTSIIGNFDINLIGMSCLSKISWNFNPTKTPSVTLNHDDNKSYNID